ncbi:hypothetical protein GCM10009798_37270 [Nocardioides panacihumi]|uniref:Uncharacterized protein n=1 Tax=Nocardioides panacihumi TaxID=400774 RepID=A0ABP5D1R4_9ACTN
MTPGCPRCQTPVASVEGSGGTWSCPEHGSVSPLWRPGEATYDEFAAHLELAGTFPTYLPWPLSPGWRLTDFGVVEGEATYTCVSGTSELDGPVDVIVVAEEPTTGLGSRCAGTVHDDPGHELGDGPPASKVRLDGQPVSLWPVSTSDAGTGTASEWDRSVLAGEGGGRWLWMVMRPASALLLLRDPWLLRDVSTLGPALLDVPFGGPAPSW